jgi:hypothetical protein
MTGLVLSHIFVREGEQDPKFNWTEKAIKKNRELKEDFYIVLCGHGVHPPRGITKAVDEVFWNQNIDEKQLGTGHPSLCIKGFEICISAGCKYTLKNRAYDYAENKDIFNHELLLSEQTHLQKGIIGDLFMYGETEYLLKWWSQSDWNYGPDGLHNLFEKSSAMEGFVQKATYLNPEQLGWKTFEDDSNVFWGHHKGYEWHGGDGIRKGA